VNKIDTNKLLHVYVSLRDFDVNPDKITAILQLQPSDVWRKNERNEITGRIYECNMWKFSSDFDSEALEAHVTHLLDKLTNIQQLESIVPVHGRIIQAVANVRKGNTSPVFSLSLETLQKLVADEFSVDVDLYVW
jgi:hypothetical protein